MKNLFCALRRAVVPLISLALIAACYENEPLETQAQGMPDVEPLDCSSWPPEGRGLCEILEGLRATTQGDPRLFLRGFCEEFTCSDALRACTYLPLDGPFNEWLDCVIEAVGVPQFPTWVNAPRGDCAAKEHDGNIKTEHQGIDCPTGCRGSLVSIYECEANLMSKEWVFQGSYDTCDSESCLQSCDEMIAYLETTTVMPGVDCKHDPDNGIVCPQNGVWGMRHRTGRLRPTECGTCADGGIDLRGGGFLFPAFINKKLSENAPRACCVDTSQGRNPDVDPPVYGTCESADGPTCVTADDVNGNCEGDYCQPGQCCGAVNDAACQSDRGPVSAGHYMLYECPGTDERRCEPRAGAGVGEEPVCHYNLPCRPSCGQLGLLQHGTDGGPRLHCVADDSYQGEGFTYSDYVASGEWTQIDVDNPVWDCSGGCWWYEP